MGSRAALQHLQLCLCSVSRTMETSKPTLQGCVRNYESYAVALNCNDCCNVCCEYVMRYDASCALCATCHNLSGTFEQRHSINRAALMPDAPCLRWSLRAPSHHQNLTLSRLQGRPLRPKGGSLRIGIGIGGGGGRTLLRLLAVAVCKSDNSLLRPYPDISWEASPPSEIEECLGAVWFGHHAVHLPCCAAPSCLLSR